MAESPVENSPPEIIEHPEEVVGEMEDLPHDNGKLPLKVKEYFRPFLIG